MTRIIHSQSEPQKAASKTAASEACHAGGNDAEGLPRNVETSGFEGQQTARRRSRSGLPSGLSSGPHLVANGLSDRQSVSSVESTVVETETNLAPTTLAPTTGSLGLPRAHAAQAKRYKALSAAGDFTLAYNSAVQEGLEYFWSESTDQSPAGYIAFSRRKGNIFVLGDPVVSAGGLANLTQAFIRRYPHATFCQISSGTAEVLQECGYYINEMGVDTTLHLPEYSFAGKTMERIRYASNWLKRRGYDIFEADYSEVDAGEIEQVSQQWRSNRNVKKREMRFLNRPIRFEDEPDVRKFFLRDADGRIMAFFYFDPLYRDGKVIGYATSIKRRHPDAPLYTEQGIMRYAVQKFKDEGKLEVKLGLSPLAWIENKTFRSNPLLHFSFRYGFSAWWVNRYFYNLQGHAAYKRHFKGEESPMHYASPVLINDVRIASMLRLTGVY